MLVKKKRRTKIVCTIGPACDTESIISEMIYAGMDVARFNLSHGPREEHGRRIDMVRSAGRKLNKRIGIMLDTRGPEIRLGYFRHGFAKLVKGSEFILTTIEVEGSSDMVSVSLKSLPDIVAPGSVILLDDGNIQVEVTKIHGGRVFTKVLNDGFLRDRKKVSIPGASIDLPAVCENDRLDLIYGAGQKIDFVAASFIRSAGDVLEVRKVLEEAGSRAHIIAKIESVQGIENLDEILATSDGVMVAREIWGWSTLPKKFHYYRKNDKCFTEVGQAGYNGHPDVGVNG